MSVPIVASAVAMLTDALPDLLVWPDASPERVEGTGGVMVVVRLGDPPIPTDTGAYGSVLVLDVLADSTQDDDGNPNDDASVQAWATFALVDPLLRDVDHGWTYDVKRDQGATLTDLEPNSSAVWLSASYRVMHS